MLVVLILLQTVNVNLETDPTVFEQFIITDLFIYLISDILLFITSINFQTGQSVKGQVLEVNITVRSVCKS